MTVDRIALITGANKGIGFEVARHLGDAGVAVLVGSRDVRRGAAAVAALGDAGAHARLVQLDVTDAASINAAVAAVATEYGRLDVLVNNAGVNVEFPGREPSALTVGELRTTFDTNVFGMLAVTNAMLPLLRRSRAGRIVNLSSELGLTELAADVNAPSITAYSMSKAAVNLLTVFYAKELRDTNVTVNSCSPGFVKTDINRGAGLRTPAEGAAAVVRIALLDDGTTGVFFPATEDRSPG
jgi:NAD(P)-dependent dehydrogenase (short-subunit alcohol dehydrogenase family)